MSALQETRMDTPNTSALARGTYRLEDALTATRGQVFLTGTQALVRLPLMQRQRDIAAGLDTAGFISGYRGSPGRLRPGTVARRGPAAGQQHQISTRHQRGSRCRRRVGQPTGGK